MVPDHFRVEPGSTVSLKKYDPTDTDDYASAEDAQSHLNEQLKHLSKLQNLLYADASRSLVIVLQGMDTAGKDGTIRHVMSGLSPLGVEVRPFKVPNEEEKAHDFLWRVQKALPRRGYIGIFNRRRTRLGGGVYVEDECRTQASGGSPRRKETATYSRMA